MARDNSVYLLVGQRGSGKSEYAKKLLANQPNLSVINRDEILRRICGTEEASIYSGVHDFAFDVMYRLLRFKLSTRKNLRLILDSWTESTNERKCLLSKLRQYGADSVVALYFVTPLKLVEEWFWQKPGIAKAGDMSKEGPGITFFSKDSVMEDFKIFHRYARNINSNGFDEVIRVNPLDPLIVLK